MTFNKAMHFGTSWGTSYDASTTAWINAVVAAGGSVSDTQKARVDALIVSLKSDAIFTNLDRLWLYGGESSVKQAGIDIINLGTHTIYGTPTLSAYGYTGDSGSSSGIDTLLVPSAGGINYVQDSASYGVYVQTHNGDGTTLMGVVATTHAYFNPQSATAPRFYMNSGTFQDPTSTTVVGFNMATRTGANDVAFYHNGSSIFTNNANASVGVPTQSFGVFARHDGSGNNFSGNTDSLISAVWFGSGLNSTKVGNLATRINTYMTAWEINAY